MDVINILEAVVSTMDTISISGIDNQDKFVGCANAVQSVIKHLREQAASHEGKLKEDVNNG